MKVSSLTGQHNYFEDFTVGEVLKHARGKTVEPHRAGVDHQRHDEHRRGSLQRAPDEVESVGQAAGLPAASPSRCASALPPRTRPRTR